ncbi:hypothetical protein P7K49_009318, partial [Saguinus oedipus]
MGYPTCTSTLRGSCHTMTQLQVEDWPHPTAGAIQCLPCNPWIPLAGKLVWKLEQL